jgi:PAS domain S-box-containing protein
MNSEINKDQNTAFDPGAAVHDQPGVHARPLALLAKAIVIIFVCDIAVMAFLDKVVKPDANLDIILCPLFLSTVSAVMLYWIIRPINNTLEIIKKSGRNLDLFRSLIDKSNDLIFIIEPKTAKILYANYSACMMLGYGRPEILKMTVSDISEHFIINSWAEYSGKVRKDGFVLIDKARRKDGAVIPVEVNSSIVTLDGRDYMVSLVRDITEREQTKMRLAESETIKKIAECSKDAILMMGPKGEISFWNPSAERIFGYSQNEAIGKHLHSLLAPKRFSDAYQKGLSRFRVTGRGAAIGKTLKLAAVRKNGEEFSIELSVDSVCLNDQWHAVGIIRDISESKKTETDLESKNNVKSTAAN